MAAGKLKVGCQKGVKYLLKHREGVQSGKKSIITQLDFQECFIFDIMATAFFFPYGPLVDIVILAPQTLKIVHTEFESNRNHHRNAN